jgi:prepilin-type N-terminal cleavage/methylation domain-containing protein
MRGFAIRGRDSLQRAFTLIELLVVIAIIVLMMTLAIPAFTAIRGGTDFASEVYNIAGTLGKARAYAMANNTYVLAGIIEVSGAQDTSANPQVSGTGRVVMALFASASGVRPYSMTGLAAWVSGGYGAGSAFTPVGSLLQCPNLDLVDLQNGSSAPPAPPYGMARPPVAGANAIFDIPNSACKPYAQFGWPQGSSLSGTPAPQYYFGYSALTPKSYVIEFDPQGCARIINTTTFAAIPQYIEIGLQPAHGASAAAPPAVQTSGQIAAIQINGISGAVQIYRP